MNVLILLVLFHMTAKEGAIINVNLPNGEAKDRSMVAQMEGKEKKVVNSFAEDETPLTKLELAILRCCDSAYRLSQRKML